VANPGVTTLLSIRTSCKSESDNVGQSFISDAEWNAFIQSAYQELYGKIVEAFGTDYFTQTPSAGYTFTTDGINTLFALPDGSGAPSAFFKLLGVDLKLTAGNQWVSLSPFAMADRNRYSTFNGGIPAAGQTVRVLYVPRLTVPTQDTDLIDGVNGWEDWMVCQACLRALAKEESNVSVFAARLAALEKRLASEIENRDASAGGGGSIIDTMGRKSLGMGYRLNGNNLWLIGGATPGWLPEGDWGPYPW
jgi:hypothetical protein